MKKILYPFLVIFLGCTGTTQKENNDWIQLFNGENLDNWTIKFNHYPLNENYNNTFRVTDGKLVVNYDQYEGFTDEFGHVFYKTAFSSYKLRLEYCFTGDQVPGGPRWAFKNSGIMFHSQSPESMAIDQRFPVSIEAQLLGGNKEEERPTGNVCTPGTHIVMNNELITAHCTSSSSKTYYGEEWIKFELVVHADSIIHHIVEGDTVLTYSKPQIGGELPAGYSYPERPTLKEGYISLQAESHPVEFRNIELLDLSH